MTVGVDIFAPRPASAADRPPRVPGVRLLDEVVEMELAVPAADRPRARHTVVAPLHTQTAGPITAAAMDALVRPFGVLVLDGVVFARSTLGDRPATEILTRGDIFDLWDQEEAWLVPVHTEHVVHRPARLAVLDARFRVAARRWPALYDVVRAQMAQQARRASRALAILQLPRVEDRVFAFFLDLGERLGRVTRDGVAIDLPLTHSLIGEVVGGRRPTVSLAMAGLTAAGSVSRRADGAWLVASPSPAA